MISNYNAFINTIQTFLNEISSAKGINKYKLITNLFNDLYNNRQIINKMNNKSFNIILIKKLNELINEIKDKLFNHEINLEAIEASKCLYNLLDINFKFKEYKLI